jgi:hypothetical protein
LKDPHRKVGVFRISKSCSRRAAGLERSHRRRPLEPIRSVTDDAHPDVGRRAGDDVGVRLVSGVGLNGVHCEVSARVIEYVDWNTWPTRTGHYPGATASRYSGAATAENLEPPPFSDGLREIPATISRQSTPRHVAWEEERSPRHTLETRIGQCRRQWVALTNLCDVPNSYSIRNVPHVDPLGIANAVPAVRDLRACRGWELLSRSEQSE